MQIMIFSQIFYFRIFKNLFCVDIICKILLFQVMMFRWDFLNHPYIYKDKQLFSTINKIIIVVVRKFACIKRLSFNFIKLLLITFVTIETVAYFVFNSTNFRFLSSCLYLNLSLWIPSERLFTRDDIEFNINLSLSINYTIQNIFFVVSSPFLPIPVTSLSSVTVKIIYFSVFSPKQVIFFVDSSANTFLIKW